MLPDLASVLALLLPIGVSLLVLLLPSSERKPPTKEVTSINLEELRRELVSKYGEPDPKTLPTSVNLQELRDELERRI